MIYIDNGNMVINVNKCYEINNMVRYIDNPRNNPSWLLCLLKSKFVHRHGILGSDHRNGICLHINHISKDYSYVVYIEGYHMNVLMVNKSRRTRRV